MISNQILQDTIDGLKSITRTDLCVLDTEGKVLASTLKDIDDCEDSVHAFVDSPAESQVVRGYQFFKVFDDNQLEHILMAKGETDDTYMVARSQHSRFRIFLLHTRKDLTRITLSRTSFLTISFWLISTTGQRSSTSTQM